MIDVINTPKAPSRMQKTLDWILARLSETSTWQGFIGIITACGITIQPELAAQIVSAGMAVIGVINVITKEKGN